jgi:SAM-dependent methyltransferase
MVATIYRGEAQLKASFAEHLVCPICLGPLQVKAVQLDNTLPWDEILAGTLNCPACLRNYPIVGGVPRMLVGELSEQTQNTAEGFGYEWQIFDAQIKDSFATDKSLFLDFIYPANESYFRDKIVMDAGCGMGRFLKLGSAFGSKMIVGVDLSEAVNAAYQNTRLLENAHVVQADIMALPFSQKFDYIFSVGVLHHLQEPQMGFSKLVEQLRENGRISVWVYAEENNDWVVRIISPIRTHITSRLPKPVLYLISRILGAFLYLCLQLIYKPANQRRLGARLKLYRLLPYNDYLYYSARLNYPSLVMVIFDHLVPQLSAYISHDELEAWFHDAGLDFNSISSRNTMSWRGLGTCSLSVYDPGNSP